MTSNQEPRTANRRILADLATNAGLPLDRLRSLENFIAFKDAASKLHSGIVIAPDGVTVAGKGIHTIDDVENKRVCSEVRKFIDQEVSEARRADVRKAVFGNSSGGIALNTGSKRTHAGANPTPASGFPTGNSFNDSDDHSDDDLEGAVIDKNCDQIRRKIRALIDSKEMKIGEFCDAIGVSNNSYNTFIRQSGPSKGMGSATFHNAWAFFKKREMKGIPDPKNNKKRKISADSVSKAPQTDISDVHLEGEEMDSVEIYDTCDEVRRKINAYLKKDGVTQAQFLRGLAAQFRSKNQRIQSSQLAAFRNKKGPDAGNTSCVYYAAYCFFERLRIKEGKKKSKTREEMEKIYSGRGGVDTTRPSHTRGFWLGPGEHVRQDKYGRFAIGSGSFQSF